MKTHTLKITSLFVIAMLLLSACSALPANGGSKTGLLGSASSAAANITQNNAQSSAQSTPQPTAISQVSNTNGLVAAYEGVLENVYTQVNPSVVNIRVVQPQSATTLDLNQFGFNNPQNSQPQTPQYSQGLASGFVWDGEGHIVTNNHVIDGATKIEVTFSDGTVLPATLVGADPYSDLAVIKVDGATDLLRPVQLADSTQVKVGELAIAIGNPYGLEGTMTVGIVSALGRLLPSSNNTINGAVYSIPDVIQTDAPINPGNSGGVLVDEQGRVMGVTAAIESTVNANSGIGFVIPSAMVNKVVPSLIKTGNYDHSYLGISGTTLTPDLAKAMNLPAGQHGALVISVVTDGPASKAGLQPSQNTTTIDGQDVPIGGDVITAINGQSLNTMDDLIAYLSDNTEVGQTVKLTVLREGKETPLDVTLAARPTATPAPETTQNTPSQSSPNSGTSNNVWLGILGANLTTEIAKAMKLDQNQQGVLVVQVEIGSPADQAKLQGSDQEVTINGQTVVIGGDIITAVDGKAVSSLSDLRSVISTYKAGTEVKLTILRGGSTLEVPVTLAERPSSVP